MDIQELLTLVKECLSIVPSATAKDNEITMLIKSAIADMTRLGIEFDKDNPIHQTATAFFVKANFGMTDVAQKELCLKTYNLLVSPLSIKNEEE